MLEGLYPKFLDMGYSPSLFWESSLSEVVDLFESFSRQQERKRREQEAEFKNRVLSLQVLALQIRDAVFAQKPEEFRTVQHYYPELFGAGRNGAENAVDRQLVERNEKLRKYAAVHNKRWRQAHGKEVDI